MLKGTLDQEGAREVKEAWRWYKRMSIQWNLLAVCSSGMRFLCDPKSQQKPVLLRCVAPGKKLKEDKLLLSPGGARETRTAAGGELETHTLGTFSDSVQVDTIGPHGGDSLR